MISNATLKEIGKRLFSAESVILFPHESPDGDSIGSCVALCLALRGRGVDCCVLIDEPLAEYIGFLDKTAGDETPCCTADRDCISDPQICMFVDCCGDDRICGREAKFRSGKESFCIDHHKISECTEDMYYIDSEEAATTQIVYALLKECDVEIERKMANAIFTGLCTDTGNFQYSNTSPKTHRIASELLEIGVDHEEIMSSLYRNVDFRQIRLESAAVKNIELIGGGQAALACITQELLRDVGAEPEHAENLINVLRDIKGVEIAAVLKEKEPDTTKVSFRAKSRADVCRIAETFGGGGHVRSSGCTINTDIRTARKRVRQAIERALAAEAEQAREM